MDLGPPIYVGPAGRTRQERVRVFGRGRGPIEVEAYRVVNVAENPELRGQAIGGALHRLDDGEVIDVPFIYHDPAAQRFVLVIPHAARGRELSERAKFLDTLLPPSEFQAHSSTDLAPLISDAIAFGIEMSNSLLVQAVGFGLAPDVQRLLAALGQNFRQTLSAASGHGLSEPQIQTSWKALVELGQIHGTSTAPGLSCTMDH